MQSTDVSGACHLAQLKENQNTGEAIKSNNYMQCQGGASKSQ